MIYNNILETIGNTPIIKLSKLKSKLNLESNIYVKVESFNPMSSIKDRTSFALIQNAIKKSKITSDTTIIEATSGNTGIGLAFICAYLNIKLEIAMPESMSEERKRLVKAFGAKLILTPADKGMKGAIAYQNEKIKEDPNYIKMGQFENQANTKIHYQQTAKEILKDFKNQNLDYFVAGIGTGGTITGVAKKLKEKNQEIKIIGVEPKDSNILNNGKPGPHKIQGIGAGFIPKILKTNLIDKVLEITTQEAFDFARTLAQTEGILAGISSGAALAAAVKIAKENPNKEILVILPDTGERYLTTELYNV